MSLFVATASFSSEASMWQLLLLVGISFLVGVLGGFVGLALGTMRLPAMLLLGIPAPLAAGTNIFVSTLSALTGSLRHLRDGRVDFRIVAAMGGPAVVGAFIGGFFSGVAPEELLVGLAGAFVLWQGVELAMLGRRTRSAQRKPPSLENPKIAFTWPRLTTEGGIGFGVGLLGGAVGLILG
ncbi:MAG: sulfite exporter TauE/SafE family protein, partial [Chloroflexi bacterium]|nr:sulfite exporter TauE/SafE family protein [Chloroflexota bacterium]